MSPDFVIPLEVLGLGVVISYAIALMMKILLVVIRAIKNRFPDKGAGR
jgi:hypothetical protein